MQAGVLPGNVHRAGVQGWHLCAAGGEDGEPGASQFLQRGRFCAKGAGGNFLSVRAGLGHGRAPQAATGAAGRGVFLSWRGRIGAAFEACWWL